LNTFWTGVRFALADLLKRLRERVMPRLTPGVLYINNRPVGSFSGFRILPPSPSAQDIRDGAAVDAIFDEGRRDDEKRQPKGF
jgi:hypothetical protein